MSAQQHILEHARTHAWCNPSMDDRTVLQPRRLTSDVGAINRFVTPLVQLKMPSAGTRYHIYALGRVAENMLSLPDLSDQQWITLEQAGAQGNSLCQAFTGHGRVFPRSESFVGSGRQGEIFLALRILNVYPDDMFDRGVYFQGYDGAYFESTLGVAQNLVYRSRVIESDADRSWFLNQVQTHKALAGDTMVYVNGVYCEAVLSSDLTSLARAEMAYDPSATSVVTHLLGSLSSFSSAMDQSVKMLLEHPGTMISDIHYVDDLTLHVLDSQGRYGRLLAPLDVASIRQVTHRAHSVRLSDVMSLVEDMHQDDVNACRIRVTCRKSGYTRQIQPHAERLEYLYRLPAAQVSQALQGMNATVPQWQASNLERSAYNAMIGEASAAGPSLTQVARAYGYQQMSRLFAKSTAPTYLAGNVKRAQVPIAYQSQATVIEYNSAGLLLYAGYHATLSLEYTCSNQSCAMVEFIAGQGSSFLNDQSGQVATLNPENGRWQAYIQPTSGDWRLAQPSEYTVSGNTLTWNAPGSKRVRDESTWLLNAFDVSVADGVLEFEIRRAVVILGQIQSAPVEVLFKTLDVFISTPTGVRALIQDVDYVLDWPRVRVISKRYLPANGMTQVMVRAHGLMDSQDPNDINAEDEVGFIHAGRLSVDGQYDLHDGRNTVGWIDGALALDDVLTYVEETGDYQVASGFNGLPYRLRDGHACLRMLSNELVREIHAYSQTIDANVSTYLSTRLPQPAPVLAPIAQRIALYSPFLSRVLAQLQNQVISNEQLVGHYSDDVVRSLISGPLTQLYPQDPINSAFALNENFLYVLPHPWAAPVSLSLDQYRFFNRVVKMYAKNPISVSSSIILST